MVDFSGVMLYSPVIMIVAFIAVLLFMLVKSYRELDAATRQKKKKTKQSDVDAYIGNRNNGTPGHNIVGSLCGYNIEYKGVINIDGQRI